MNEPGQKGRGRAGDQPLIVGLGGTTRPNSSCEKLLRHVLGAIESRGVRTCMFGAADLNLPHYAPEAPDRSPEARRLVDALARADGIIISSPGYHGSMSGLLKNALDYVEDLRNDDRPYLDGRAVGLIVSAAGWQGSGMALVALRNVVHALRAWPTPLGVCVNTAQPVFDDSGRCLSDTLNGQLDVLAAQLVQFSMAFATRPAAVAQPA